MISQQALALLRLKGHIDGKVMVAKAQVRAAFKAPDCGEYRYGRGYRDALRHKTVEHLREMRDTQRYLHEYCKGVGCHV